MIFLLSFIISAPVIFFPESSCCYSNNTSAKILAVHNCSIDGHHSSHTLVPDLGAMSDDVRPNSMIQAHGTASSLLSVELESKAKTMDAPTRNSSEQHRNGVDGRHGATPVSVAVDPVALITTECITVTSAMRKHARWAHSSVSAILGGSSGPSTPGFQGSRPSTPGDDLATKKGPKNRLPSTDDADDGGLANRWGLRGKKGKSMQDNPLMAGFGRLRRELVGCKGTEQSLHGHGAPLTSLKISVPSTLHPFSIHFFR